MRAVLHTEQRLNGALEGSLSATIARKAGSASRGSERVTTSP